MRMLVIILCLIGAVIAWNFIDDLMTRNMLEPAVSLAQHDPQRAVEILRENQNLLPHVEEFVTRHHETANRLFPQNADWQDWAYLSEFSDRVSAEFKLNEIFWDLDSEGKRAIIAARNRNPEKEYAREARAREEEARKERWREERRREKRAREERQNRWVIVQLAGRPELRFDISNDKGRASLIRWYNSTFHPEPHETRSRAIRRTRSGRRVGVQVEKLPGFVVPAAKFVGTAIMAGITYDLAEESGVLGPVKKAGKSVKKAGKWVWKEAIISKPWAAAELDFQEKKEIHRDLFERGLLFVPGTDQPLTPEQQSRLVIYQQKKDLRERTRQRREKEAEDAAWEAFMEVVPEDVDGSEPVLRDRDFYERGWRDRDFSEWPPRKMIKGPQTRHPQGDDGPQTGHPEYEN